MGPIERADDVGQRLGETVVPVHVGQLVKEDGPPPLLGPALKTSPGLPSIVAVWPFRRLQGPCFQQLSAMHDANDIDGAAFNTEDSAVVTPNEMAVLDTDIIDLGNHRAAIRML